MSVMRLSPKAEVHLSLRDLAMASGLSTARVRVLVNLGLVEPETDAPDRFSSATAARLRRMLRLRADLGVTISPAPPSSSISWNVSSNWTQSCRD